MKKKKMLKKLVKSKKSITSINKLKPKKKTLQKPLLKIKAKVKLATKVKIKKKIEIENVSKIKKKVVPRQRVKKPLAPILRKIPKVVISSKEISLEKKESPQVRNIPSFPAISQEELHPYYGSDRIVLQVRDPWWLYTYWEVTGAVFEKLKNELGNDFYSAKRVLRFYDISHISFNGHNAHRFFDVYINEHVNSWYVDADGPGRSWCVDLGLLLPSGKFITILRSNVAHTPLEAPSWITDEEWMIVDEKFNYLYGMGLDKGRTKSSPAGKAWQERMKLLFSSGNCSRSLV